MYRRALEGVQRLNVFIIFYIILTSFVKIVLASLKGNSLTDRSQTMWRLLKTITATVCSITNVKCWGEVNEYSFPYVLLHFDCKRAIIFFFLHFGFI